MKREFIDFIIGYEIYSVPVDIDHEEENKCEGICLCGERVEIKICPVCNNINNKI